MADRNPLYIWRDIKKAYIAQRFERGEQHLPDGTNPDAYMPLRNFQQKRTQEADANDMLTWLDLLKTEVYKVFSEEDWESIREDLIKAAAVITLWVEDGDGRNNDG